MISNPWSQQRRLVPRWRSLALTFAASELAVPNRSNDPHQTRPISSELSVKIASWRMHPGLIESAELLECALVERQESEAVGAARIIADERSTATTPLRRLAALTLIRAGMDGSDKLLKEDYGNEKNIWRRRTRSFPDNALGWVELSLGDIALGRQKQAKRSMLVALGLAPNNRHVLRSASRLFLHLHEEDRAHDLFLRSPATPHDPWLIAAEIALADTAGRTSRFIVQGRRMLEAGHHLPRQVTELSGAVATAELIGGRRKKARDLFRESIKDPNGNALAQAEWASPAFGTEIVPIKRLSETSDADEAKVFQLMREQNWAEVPAACQRWADVEPYSIRPYEFGSTVASHFGDLQLALKMINKGLMVRPTSENLLNANAFVLASMGRFNEAEASLRSIIAGDASVDNTKEANLGLIALRKGELDEGRACYRRAIEGFRRSNLYHYACSANAFFAREASRANLPESGKLIAEAKEDLKKTGSIFAARIVAEAESFFRNHQPA